MRARGQDGFSLLELIVSLSLSTLVLIGVISMATTAIRNEYVGIKAGQVSGITLTALDAMNRELENATYIRAGTTPTGTRPRPGVTNFTGGGNGVFGCLNFSPTLKGVPGINGGSGKPDNSQAGNAGFGCFHYCVKAGATPGRFDTLYRYPQAGVYMNIADPTAFAAPVCGDPDAYGSTQDVLVINNVSTMDEATNPNYFARETVGAALTGNILVHFIVGNSTNTTNPPAGTFRPPTPIAMKVDATITPQRSYEWVGGSE